MTKTIASFALVGLGALIYALLISGACVPVAEAASSLKYGRPASVHAYCDSNGALIYLTGNGGLAVLPPGADSRCVPK